MTPPNLAELAIRQGDYVLGIWSTHNPFVGVRVLLKRQPDQPWQVHVAIQHNVDEDTEDAETHRFYSWHLPPESTEEDLIRTGADIRDMAIELFACDRTAHVIIRSDDHDTIARGIAALSGVSSENVTIH